MIVVTIEFGYGRVTEIAVFCHGRTFKKQDVTIKIGVQFTHTSHTELVFPSPKRIVLKNQKKLTRSY
jgi:hypothetical protein